MPQADSSFLGVGSSETERFQPVRQTDLERLYDENLKLVNGPTGKRKQLETLLGFHIESEGVLACAVARKVLPLRKVMYDTLHNYFANGLVGLEVLLFLGKLKDITGVGLSEMKTSILEVEWQTAADNFRSLSSRKFLFHDKLWQGDFYKGSATQLYQLLPLFSFYVHRLMPIDSPYLQCFNALMRVPCPVYMYLSKRRLKGFHHL